MFNIQKAYFCLFCLSIVSLLLSPVIIKSLDELSVMAFGGLAVVDMVFNGNIRRYRLLFALEGVMLFYLIYSIAACPYNITTAKVNDFILQSKPLVALAVAYAIAPQFTQAEKTILKAVCLLVALIAFTTYVTGTSDTLLGHIYTGGAACICCAVVYMLVSVDDNRQYSLKDQFAIAAILFMGLPCTRARYYGFVVYTLYLIYVYRPGSLNLKSPRNIIVAMLLVGTVVLVAWKKISYYFGGIDVTSLLSEEMAETFARPALYFGMGLILMDHFFLGTGLASFATASSAPEINYSDVYYDYGLSVVWGLSPSHPNFICDAFFAEFAQFGFIGICLFIGFCWWMWQKWRIVMRTNGYRMFIPAVAAFGFLMIDSVAATLVLQSDGIVMAAVMGIVASQAKSVDKNEAKALLRKHATDFYVNKKVNLEYGYKF